MVTGRRLVRVLVRVLLALLGIVVLTFATVLLMAPPP